MILQCEYKITLIYYKTGSLLGRYHILTNNTRHQEDSLEKHDGLFLNRNDQTITGLCMTYMPLNHNIDYNLKMIYYNHIS